MNTKKLKIALIAAHVNYKEICERWKVLSESIVDNWKTIWHNAQLLQSATDSGVTITTGVFRAQKQSSKFTDDVTQRVSIHSAGVCFDLSDNDGITQAKWESADDWSSPNWNIGGLNLDLLYAVNDIVTVLLWNEEEEE